MPSAETLKRRNIERPQHFWNLLPVKYLNLNEILKVWNFWVILTHISKFHTKVAHLKEACRQGGGRSHAGVQDLLMCGQLLHLQSSEREQNVLCLWDYFSLSQPHSCLCLIVASPLWYDLQIIAFTLLDTFISLWIYSNLKQLKGMAQEKQNGNLSPGVSNDGLRIVNNTENSY